jgi:hypothetical protein
MSCGKSSENDLQCIIKPGRENEILQLISPYKLMSEIRQNWIIKDCLINRDSIQFHIYSQKNEKLIVSLHCHGSLQDPWLKSKSFEISLSNSSALSEENAKQIASVLTENIVANDKYLFFDESESSADKFPARDSKFISEITQWISSRIYWHILFISVIFICLFYVEFFLNRFSKRDHL